MGDFAIVGIPQQADIALAQDHVVVDGSKGQCVLCWCEALFFTTDAIVFSPPDRQVGHLADLLAKLLVGGGVAEQFISGVCVFVVIVFDAFVHADKVSTDFVFKPVFKESAFFFENGVARFRAGLCC